MLRKLKLLQNFFKIEKQNTTVLGICKLDNILNSIMYMWTFSTKCYIRSCQIKKNFRSSMVFLVHILCIVSNYSAVILAPTTISESKRRQYEVIF